MKTEVKETKTYKEVYTETRMAGNLVRRYEYIPKKGKPFTVTGLDLKEARKLRKGR